MTAALATVREVISDLAHVPARWSTLSRPTPAHMRHQALFGSDPTPAMKLGTAGHAVSFGTQIDPVMTAEQVFADGPLYEVFDVVSPKTGKITTRNSKAWEEFDRQCGVAGIIPLMPHEYEKGSRIRDALHANSDARDLLFGPGVVREQVIHWTRPILGRDAGLRACSSTPDARKPGDYIVDLKVVRSGSLDEYPRNAKKSGHPGQLCFYRESDCFDRGVSPDSLSCADLYLVTVESAPPHVVTVYKLDPTARDYGQRLLAERWTLFCESEAINYWPGYSQSIAPLMVIDEEDEEDEDDGETFIDEQDENDGTEEGGL